MGILEGFLVMMGLRGSGVIQGLFSNPIESFISFINLIEIIRIKVG